MRAIAAFCIFSIITASLPLKKRRIHEATTVAPSTFTASASTGDSTYGFNSPETKQSTIDCPWAQRIMADGYVYDGSVEERERFQSYFDASDDDIASPLRESTETEEVPWAPNGRAGFSGLVRDRRAYLCQFTSTTTVSV